MTWREPGRQPAFPDPARGDPRRVTERFFVGLFMGLGASFSVLIVAEMVGVKSVSVLSPVGAGLGGLSQYVRGAAGDGAALLRPD